MVLVVGEILIDIFPDYQRIGGAPFNFAYHLKMMGFPVRFFTRVGNDRHGRRIREKLAQSGFARDDVEVDDQYPTGTVQVKLDRRRTPQFDIRENVAFDHLALDGLTDSDLAAARMIYFGSLIQRTAQNRSRIRRIFAEKGVRTIGFCDLNLRPPHVHAEAIETCLSNADILKLNDAELDHLRQRDGGPDQQDAVVAWIMSRYSIRAVALTLGDRGSVLYRSGQVVHSRPERDREVVDTVGAGDGYAAVVAMAWMRDLSSRHTIALASEFASRICGIAGAVPDSDRFYDPLRNRLEGSRHDG